MLRFLLRIRLSYIYPILFIGFLVVLLTIQKITLTSGQLTLFSVNSFLYGYYFSPILSSQKDRVDQMAKIIRNEAIVILGILAQTHLLPDHVRLELKRKIKAYLDSIIDNPKVRADNKEYEDLLEFTSGKDAKDNPVLLDIYSRLSDTQKDRDDLNIWYNRKLYSHEWLVLLVLFGITVFFILQVDYGNVLLFNTIAALLCTGLTMLIVILVKYSTLTHKEAKRIWDPLKELRKEHFEDV